MTYCFCRGTTRHQRVQKESKTKVQLTICLHSMCSISEIKIPALPTGSKGFLNSLWTNRETYENIQGLLSKCETCGVISVSL